MKRDSLFLVLVMVAILGSTLAYAAYHSFYVLDVHERDIVFSVVDSPGIGFSADSDKIRFGRVIRGGSAGRDILLSSRLPSVARVDISDNLEEMVSVSRNEVLVMPNVTEKVSLSLFVPTDAEIGNYSGSVRVTYTRRLW